MNLIGPLRVGARVQFGGDQHVVTRYQGHLVCLRDGEGVQEWVGYRSSSAHWTSA
jgi:hypothetical protein